MEFYLFGLSIKAGIKSKCKSNGRESVFFDSLLIMCCNFFYFVLVISLCSCQKNSDMIQVIEKFKQNPVVLECDSLEKMNDKTISNINDKMWKYVVYVDSSECTMCNLKTIGEWIMVEDMFSDYREKLAFIILLELNQQNIKPLEECVEGVIRDYIYIDKTNYFSRNNPSLPKQPYLHKFLLDESNNVVLVGNIMSNQKVRGLFERIVQERFNDMTIK